MPYHYGLPVLPPDDDIEITQGQLNRMLLESHAKAASVTEEVMAIRELAKINGHYQERKGLTINLNTIHQQVSQYTDAQLLEAMGQDPDALALPAPIDHDIDLTTVDYTVSIDKVRT